MEEASEDAQVLIVPSLPDTSTHSGKYRNYVRSSLALGLSLSKALFHHKVSCDSKESHSSGSSRASWLGLDRPLSCDGLLLRDTTHT